MQKITNKSCGKAGTKILSTIVEEIVREGDWGQRKDDMGELRRPSLLVMPQLDLERKKWSLPKTESQKGTRVEERVCAKAQMWV